MLEQQERAVLHPRAAFSDACRGRSRPERACSVRPAFQHDRDKILHSKAFRRLMHKTQVFLAPQGDHFRTRMTHTLEVTQIARTLARALRLNEQLTEAIGLGHDLGHTPFGHAGEAVLDELVPGGFRHVQQSVRVVEVLERDGKGLNLCAEVVDGIAGHSKGKGRILEGARLPATLEGQLVRLADITAYVNHDLDDALRAGVIDLSDVPRELLSVLGRTHSKRISRIVTDVIDETDLDRDARIRLRAETERALSELRDFLYSRVYENPAVHEEFTKCRKLLSDIYLRLVGEPRLFRRLTGQRLPAGSKARKQAVCDFVAGMTDRYAMRVYEALFVPQPFPVELKID
ncbi:MAG: deoxyguanosinetriphosphate triphosphohydrolase [Deltaproteobacteria bacterium]|nr:deoxyguanosinetriphosphate triphosphohydrolase [Deltaproteobacteria bacterium]